MGPKFEWHIGDEIGQRTEAKTPPRPLRSRWQKIGVAFAVFLGICLGVIYVSIPELSKRPISTPPPRTLTPLEATIDREAQALATFDIKTFVAIQDPDDPWWHQERFQSGYWEQPRFGPLYTIVNSGTLAPNRAWADVVQYRNGQYFRETRFYRLRGNQWVRTRPFSDFWSGEPQTMRTEHFDLAFHEQDAPLVKMVADQFEQIYALTCIDLDCPVNRDGSLPRTITMTLVFRPDAGRLDLDWDSKTFILPSPRIQGLYFMDLYGSLPGDNLSLLGMAYSLVPQFVAQMVTGGDERWSRSQNGSLFVRIMGGQETSRILAKTDVSDAVVFSYLPDITDVVPLETLWDTTWSYTSTPPNAMVAEAWTVIRFIEKRYGPDEAISFLHAIGPATSISRAIEMSLHIPYTDFERQWRVWLKQLL
jgi:hypothetical protein